MTTVLTPQTKHSTSFSLESKGNGVGADIVIGNPIGLLLVLTYAEPHSGGSTSIVFTPEVKSKNSLITAAAGQYRGFGAFNYAGGETLGSNSYPIFIPQTKH